MAFHKKLEETVKSGGSTVVSGGQSAVSTVTSGGKSAASSPGGFVSGITGVSEWKQSETHDELDEQAASGPFGYIDAGARALTDLTLDNPNASLQEGVQRGLVGAYRTGQVASGQEVTATDEDVASAFQGAAGNFTQTTEDAIEGTAFDNRATDAAAWAGRAVIAEPGKAVLGGLTGVDVDEGDTEATVGAVDMFDVGVTAATAGGGKLALSAARSSDEVGRLGAKALRGSDETGGLVGRVLGGGSDDAASGADDAAGALPSGAADEATPALPAPEGALDDSGRLGSRLSGGSDDAAGAADDSGGFFAGLGDDSASAADDAARSADDGTAALPAPEGAIDDAAGAADDAEYGLFGRAMQGLERTFGFGPAGRAADDAARSADDVNRPLSGLFDSSSRAADDAAGAADDAARAGDDAAGAADDTSKPLSGLFDDTATATDDAARGADDAARAGDDAAGAADESDGFLSRVLSRGSDDAASGADDVAGAADDAADDGAGLLSRGLSSTTGKVGLGTGLFLAGGAAVNQLSGGPQEAPDESETADGLAFQAGKQLDPTEKYPRGGVLYNVQRDFQTIGYWVLLGTRGRNLILLDESGETRQAKISVEDFQQRGVGQQQGGSSQ